mmetsp:Transcript_58663/g.138149  ORF Transcript_58663/g.138149 Transcript_58663/m.138149 type:complete len:201 (-) Transcript_58663:22-624(-)
MGKRFMLDSRAFVSASSWESFFWLYSFHGTTQLRTDLHGNKSSGTSQRSLIRKPKVPTSMAPNHRLSMYMGSFITSVSLEHLNVINAASSYFLPPKQDPASNSTGSVSVAFDCDNFDSKSKAHSWRVNATKEVWVDTDDSSKKATCDSPKTALKLAKAMIIVGSLLIGLCGGLPLLFAIIMLVVQLTKKVVRVVRYVEMK